MKKYFENEKWLVVQTKNKGTHRIIKRINPDSEECKPLTDKEWKEKGYKKISEKKFNKTVQNLCDKTNEYCKILDKCIERTESAKN